MKDDGDSECWRALRVFCRRRLERLRIRRKVMEQCGVKMGLRVFSKWVWEAQTVAEGNR